MSQLIHQLFGTAAATPAQLAIAAGEMLARLTNSQSRINHRLFRQRSTSRSIRQRLGKRRQPLANRQRFCDPTRFRLRCSVVVADDLA